MFGTYAYLGPHKVGIKQIWKVLHLGRWHDWSCIYGFQWFTRVASVRGQISPFPVRPVDDQMLQLLSQDF